MKLQRPRDARPRTAEAESGAAEVFPRWPEHQGGAGPREGADSTSSHETDDLKNESLHVFALLAGRPRILLRRFVGAML